MPSFGMRDRIMRGNMNFEELSVHPPLGTKKRLLGFGNVSYRQIDVLIPCVTSVAVSPIIFPEVRPWLPPRSFSEEFPAAEP